MQLTMLGCGSSAGVPRIGSAWRRTDPHNPRNRRLRASVIVEHGATRLLVDTGPDLRAQLLEARVDWLTAVLYTHDHADHCHGIDELRGIVRQQGRQVDCYMDVHTHSGLRTRFPYIFSGGFGYSAVVQAHLITEDMQFGNIRVRPFRQQHGPIHSIGYRFDADGRSIAYSTDLSGIPDESWPLLEGLDLWVVDALRREPHPTHSHLAQTLDWIASAAPAEAWLTHMDESMDYDELLDELPSGVSPGWDGRVWISGD